MRARPDVLSDVVDPDDVDARGDPEDGGRQGRLEALLRRQVEDPAQGRLPRRPEQDRAAQDRQATELAEEGEIVLGRLPESESRVDDHVVPGDARPERPFDRPLEVGHDLGQERRVARPRPGCA